MQKIHILFIATSILSISYFNFCLAAHQNYDDNDFAEFEDTDEYTGTSTKPKQKSQQPLKPDIEQKPQSSEPHSIIEDDDFDEVDIEDEEDNIVELKEEEIRARRKPNIDDEEEAIVQDEEENDEFSHFSDEEEFIGFDSDKPQGQSNNKINRNQDEPKITIAKVPLHLRSNWDSFYLEMLMVSGLVVYFVNFMLGKGKNQKLATMWYNNHKSLLESNFALVGDDGKTEIESPGLRKESENCYILWCSGRSMMEGMLIEIKLLKRQDLIGVFSQLIRPASDQLIIKVLLEEMDNFVFLLGNKKSVGKLAKEMTDVSTYCPEKKTVEKFGYSSQFMVHSELNEVTLAILKDSKLIAMVNKYPGLVDYFHFSDQYSGPKQPEDSQPTKLPDVKKVLIFCFNFPNKGNLCSESMENLKPLTQLVLYMADKLARMKLTKEAKMKAERNRSKVEENFLKSTHAARAEIAQTTREEKKRKERERIMSLDDPDKQRKWEEREQRRQMKRRAPKMKTLKIKPM